MQSLKTFLPELSKVIDVTVDQAYERQRLMVKAGILRARAGRGPGSGVPASPKNVAMLLTALLIGDLREHSISSIRSVANAKPLGQCPVNGTARFADAVAKMILDGFPNFFDWPEEIVVERDRLCAEIRWPNHSAAFRTIYPAHSSSLERKRLHVDGVLVGHALLKIRNALVLNRPEEQ